MSEQSIETRCVQAGYTPGNGEPRQVPIVQSTTFKYDTSDAMGRLFDLEDTGYFYTRLQNPTNDYVAAKIASLEGGTAAMLTSSGQAANFFAVFNICEAGGHVVASSAIYGGTFNLLAHTLGKMGIECTFVDPNCTPEELDAAFRPNTKCVFGETIANPALAVLDIEKFATAAHAHGVPLIVDNTFPTPINCRPIEWGADIVTHSTTKYMDGHGACVGGAIVDSGKFDWMANAERFPGLTTPDESYHGIVYVEKFGQAGAYITKATSQLMRDFGSIQSPQNAFYLNLGLESLHVRVPQHCKNARAVAEFLSTSDKVASVRYPDLPGDPYHKLAEKYLPNGSCGVVSFEVAGGREAAERFMAGLRVFAIETHVADARSCCLHPASSTHRQMTNDELVAAGISPAMVRMSCGIEGTDDLVADVEQALARV
ncbi:bifunctional O-acetylhomoserine aminocarboxypropyltransferase/cysteine synthase [Olsenella sp. AF16-14LB]|jgi:O-acetylhomoserine (thiol)-lyase|uniref:O-acetylhomoserine aminocarboxypropyltransferase/cysteine synthase family protein n=1 Tax=Atopobiaceae TaxID=1643824 RepID=UPI000509B878|nr:MULTISPECIES: PLP-dependent transferase [unclassified Olsenella]RGJ45016.1 bifunctional O-acetylhomoserine aminocarboxypropyltransferase/cysteine synthase [Olsenella sp. TM06-36]RGS51322.1 bifunctional O-acetylhomoserine aminocarboxypropyltransferase/cysteine synthase [Olsenella sp. AF21-51]RGU50157.1 bifunctional O-acetylhomoserine aminocarboxypropyltransferase/cysteine synthase [Olsenella sp. AF16-14LB]RGU80827.1 bifunctional O-acetylhomoserine aminocarboxypropyltransferase/cysteine syntha